MKKVRFILSMVLVVLNTTVLYAQSNIAVDSYYLGDYEKAKELFEKKIAEDPETSNFYLGEIAFLKGDITKAEAYYNEGLRANAESISNKIGLIQTKLKTNPKEAENELNVIAKKNKKKVEVLLMIGRAYMNNGMISQAMDKVNAAKKVDDKYPGSYILEGDILVSENAKEKVGEAAGKYEMATYFSPDYVLGYMKVAQFYEYINPTLAIKELKTVIEEQPDYMLAYGYLGKLYTQNGFYPEAIAMFKTYFTSGIYTVEDTERYARAYYFTDNFTEAEKLVNDGLGENPDHFVLNRYKMYIYDKTNNPEDGIKEADKFFALRDTGGYIAKDYAVYASILNKAKNYDDAYMQYDKAISMEPENMELYSEAILAARESKYYAMAAYYLKKQMDEKTKVSGAGYPDELIDINTLGYDYYSAGISVSKNKPLAEKLMKDDDLVTEMLQLNNDIITDSLSDVDYFSKMYALYNLNKADSVFDILLGKAPDSYSGYRYKALTKHAINPLIEEGLAKPHYEKVIEIITKNKEDFSASDKKVLLEAYNYLGYYYYMKSDKDNTILYWEKVLELDPENKNAMLVLEDIKKQ